MGRPLSLRAFLPLVSDNFVWDAGQHGWQTQGILEEKSKYRVEISKENMVTYKSPHFIPCISSFYVYLLCEGPRKKQRSHFSLKSNTAHFYFPICSTVSVFLTNSHSIEDPCRVKHCTKCITLLPYLLRKWLSEIGKVASLLSMRKVSLRKAKHLVWRYMASRWKSWDLSQFYPKPISFS